MKKLSKLTLCGLAIAMLRGLIMTARVYGQPCSEACDASASDAVQASHILGVRYHDLDPFNGLVGESNQWGMGTVYLNTGDSVPDRFLVYNAIGSNLLTFKYGTEIILTADKSTIRKFVMKSEKQKNRRITYEFFPMSNRYYSEGDGAFLEVLVEDTVSLYCLETIEKFPMSGKLMAHTYYFVQLPAGDLKRVRLTSGSLFRALECFGDFQKHLHSLHIKTRKRSGLIESVTEYNKFIRGK